MCYFCDHATRASVTNFSVMLVKIDPQLAQATPLRGDAPPRRARPMAASVSSAPGAGPPEWEYLPIGGMHDQVCVGELAEMGRGLVELSTTSDTPVRVIFSPVDAPTRGLGGCLCFVVLSQRAAALAARTHGTRDEFRVLEFGGFTLKEGSEGLRFWY